MTHLGIDYGSNLAGTTAICFQQDQSLHIRSSVKKQRADQFIADFVAGADYEQIFIDAPLSLPSAYHNQGDDFFYRICDRELKAMSPMFLGGLTARAMALKNKLSNIAFYETYPRQLVRLMPLEVQKQYKADIQGFVMQLSDVLSLDIKTEISTWHMVDSILAWCSGRRFAQGEHRAYGSADEGTIIV